MNGRPGRVLLLVACVSLVGLAVSHQLVNSRNIGALSSGDQDDTPLPYLGWYNSLESTGARIAYVAGLTAWLLFLFSFIGIVASDFFCPNLSTISSYLGLSESVAGSTLLAFGNGSPDVFSTFASMSAGSGSLAIGELLGAAAFIVSVVAGIMTIVKPFKVARHTFLRDVGFFTAAVMFVLVILWDKQITQLEAVMMIVLYTAYVIAVVSSSWWHGRRERIREAIRKAREEYAEDDVQGVNGNGPLTPYRDASPTSSLPSSGCPTPRRHPSLFYASIDEEGQLDRPESITIAPSSPLLGSRRRSASIAGTALGRTRKTHRPAVRPSLLSAIEFRDVVNSLAENSGANALTVFEGLASPRQGRPASRTWGDPRSLSQIPEVGLGLEGTEMPYARPSHRRAISTTGIPSDADFDASVWDKTPNSKSTPNRVDLINLSEGVEDPWRNTPESASPMQPRQLLKLDTSVTQSDLRASPQPMSSTDYMLEGRDVPSIIVVDESGQQSPIDLSSPPESPHTFRLPKWIASNSKKRRRIRMLTRSLRAALFPSLTGLRKKSAVGALLAVISTPAILVLILTLPVVDEEGRDESFEVHEKEVVVSHHTLTSRMEHTSIEGDEEDQAGWQERARLRAQHIGHVLHSPAAFHRPGPSSESYSNPVDLERVDQELLRHSPQDEEVPEASIGVPRQFLPAGGSSPPASLKADICQDDMDAKVADGVVVVQCILSPFFVLLVLFSDDLHPWYWLAAGATSMILFLAASLILRSPKRKGQVFLCLIGFVVAMVWLLTCVNEVVGVLQALGHVFRLSDAILGITVFALGNSTADLVANYTIAKMGYPVMAIAACYGGPLLNLLLGVGISGSYFIAKTGEPFYIDFDVTLFTTCTALLLLLGKCFRAIKSRRDPETAITLIFIPLNDYTMTRKWGFFLIAFYIAMTIINVIVEIKREKSHSL